MNELLLVRHGESEGNTARERAEAAAAEVIDVRQRDPDVPLSELGRKQSAALTDAFDGLSFAQVWSSPYVRAAQTARIATGGRSRLRYDERLRDRELGILDRLTARGVAARFPEEAERRTWLGKMYYRPPGGESWADVALRLRSWLRELSDQPGRVLVVTHDAVILLLRYVCEGMDEQALLELAARSSLGNASVTRLVREQERWRTTAFDDRSHLGDLMTDHPAEKQHVHPR